MYPPQYPYPYQYTPVPVAPPPPTTRKGVSWCVRALMIYFVALLLTAISGVVAIAILGSLPQNPDLFTLLGALLPVLALSAAAGIISFICLIFYLVGFGYLYKGRNEFGPTHARNVKIALYLLILAFALDLTAVITATVMSLYAFRFDPITRTTVFDPGILYAVQAVSIGFGIVVAACVAAHLVLSIRGLAKPQHERLLYVAAAVGTATPGVAGALALLFLPGYIASIANAGTGGFGFRLGPEVGIPTLVSAGLTFVTILLFLLAFRGAEGMLRTGELKPMLPPVQPPSWMPGPVGPYVPYGPYAPQVPMTPAAPPQSPPMPPPNP